MVSSTLFLIDSDPRTSARPAEAIRIAAGVGTWKRTKVRVCLFGPAVLILSEWVDEFVDEDNYTRYLPILRELGHEVWIEENSSFLSEIEVPTWSYAQINYQELAREISQADHVLRF